MKTAAAEHNARFSRSAGDLDDRFDQGVVKLRDHVAGANAITHVRYDLADSRFPFDHHG